MTTVYLSSFKGRYHTREDCPNLKKAKYVWPKEKDEIDQDLEQCFCCQGNAPGYQSPSHKTRNKLLELNPEDV